MISIKHRYSETTLCEFNVETIKEAAEKGKADLRGANLSGASLYGAKLREADLYGANLRGADLREASLYGANLREADLREADLYGADLHGANLREADLREASLYGAKLREADLYGANLRGANLYGANLYGANLYGADLYGAKIDDEAVNKTPIAVAGLTYWCLITEGFMRLGCKRFSHQEWAAFSDEQISEMDDGALEFWKQWKEPLLAMCKAHAG